MKTLTVAEKLIVERAKSKIQSGQRDKLTAAELKVLHKAELASKHGQDPVEGGEGGDNYDEIRRLMVQSLRRKAAAGDSLKPDEWRMLLDDRDREHVWQNRKACADELSRDLGHIVAVRVLYEWKRQGAPIPRTGPILKMAVWRWLATEKRAQGRPGDPACATLKERKTEAEVQLLKARLAETSGRMAAEARDAARQTIIRLATDIRQAFVTRLPEILADSLAGDKDRIAWEAMARRIIEDYSVQVREMLGKNQEGGDGRTPEL
jgi:hypothetical protein